MLSLNVRTPVHENNHASHRVQDPSLIRISQQVPAVSPSMEWLRYQISLKFPYFQMSESFRILGVSVFVAVNFRDQISNFQISQKLAEICIFRWKFQIDPEVPGNCRGKIVRHPFTDIQNQLKIYFKTEKNT